MEFFEITSHYIQEPGVKQERDLPENEESEMIHQQNNLIDDEGNIPMEELKYEVTSDDDNDNTQLSDNNECHNSQVLCDSEYINVYDDMIDIKNETQILDDAKFDISEILDNVGSRTTPVALNIESNQASSDEDIPLQRLRSKKGVKLNEDTENGATLKQWRPITARPRPVNTDTASTPRLHRKHSCSHCTYTTDIISHMKRHSILHTGDKPFACDNCDYKSTRKDHLKRHLISHTDKKRFACDICDYKCALKDTLNMHVMSHIGRKPFACDKCDYTCAKRYTLKMHLMSHTGRKPFACAKCDYTSPEISTLKKHLMTHTGEKPFACSMCDYKSSQKGSLKKHLMCHTGEKRFACDKCDYKCSKKLVLKLHLITHTEEKPFTCDKCGYKCNRKGSLRLHIKSHI